MQRNSKKNEVKSSVIEAAQNKDIAKVLLESAKYTNIVNEENRIKSVNGQKQDSVDEVQPSVFEFLKKLNNEIDDNSTFTFYWELCNFVRCGFFELDVNAKEVEKGFNNFNIEIPHLIKDRFNEIQWRKGYIEKFIDNKRYEWDNSKIEEIEGDIHNDLQLHTFDTVSIIKYLGEMFKVLVDEIKTTEKEIDSIHVEKFYNNEGVFVATKDTINNYFWHSLRGGLDAETTFLRFIKYFENRNKIIVIKKKIQLLSTPPASEEIGQGKVKKEQKGGNRVPPLTKQEHLNVYNRYVKDICQRYKGQQQAKYPKLSDIMRDAISKPNQKSEKQLGRYADDLNQFAEDSDKTLLTYTGQVVRQYCTYNSLNFSWFR